MTAHTTAPTGWRWPHLISGVANELPKPGTPLQLRAARCAACDRTTFPARDACEWCGSATNAHVLPSAGRVVGHTEVLLDSPGSSISAPYFVALGRLDDVDVLGIAESGVRTGDCVYTVAARLFGTSELHFAFRTFASDPD